MWHGFHKMLKTFLWDSLLCWHDCIMQFLRICQLRIHAANVMFYHIQNPKGVLLDSDPVAGKATEHHWTLCDVKQWYSNRLLHSSDDWLVLQAQSVPRKHSPHHYTTAMSLDCHILSLVWFWFVFLLFIIISYEYLFLAFCHFLALVFPSYVFVFYVYLGSERTLPKSLCLTLSVISASDAVSRNFPSLLVCWTFLLYPHLHNHYLSCIM